MQQKEKADMADYILGYINALLEMNKARTIADSDYHAAYECGFKEALELVRKELISVVQWQRGADYYDKQRNCSRME